MSISEQRYCFVLPDLWRPMGGQTVLYEMAAMLRDIGHETVLIHGGRFHRYAFAETDCEVFYLPELAALGRAEGWAKRARRMMKRMAERGSNLPAPLFRPTARDVMVIPEFSYQTYESLFPNVPLVMVAQDPTALLRAFSQDTEGAYARFASVLSTSETSARSVRTLLSRDSHRMILPVAREGLRADHPKKLQIAYMPRKLRLQSQRVIQTLKRRPALADVPVVVIENMSNAERDQALNESLIFLAFSNMEGFGLPPAEAMAAGCLVIGYTGVGANEFFTPETGFVVEQNDTPEMVAQVERAITGYRENPAPLDQLRARAAQFVATRYSQERALESLRGAWKAVEADILARGEP